MRNNKILAGIAATAFLALAACSTQKGPATEAVTAAEAALATVREEASRFLPSDLQGVEASVSALKAQLASKDYKSVLANAPALMTSINSLTDATSARKAAVEAATKAGYESLKGTWDAANAAAAAGDPVDAVAKAKEVQSKGNEVLALLGMAG